LISEYTELTHVNRFRWSDWKSTGHGQQSTAHSGQWPMLTISF